MEMHMGMSQNEVLFLFWTLPRILSNFHDKNGHLILSKTHPSAAGILYV